jgi:uncharacterized membrane protein
VDLGIKFNNSNNDNKHFDYYVPAISADGSVLAFSGYDTAAGKSRVYRWTAATGAVDLGMDMVYANYYNLVELNISADGSTVIARGDTEGVIRRWTAATGSRVVDRSGYFYSDTTGVIVAYTSQATGHATRWTTAGVQDLGTMGGSWSEVSALSPDGVVVGGLSPLQGGTPTVDCIWTPAERLRVGTYVSYYGIKQITKVLYS